MKFRMENQVLQIRVSPALAAHEINHKAKLVEVFVMASLEMLLAFISDMNISWVTCRIATGIPKESQSTVNYQKAGWKHLKH
jgi:hypothetical protein